MRGWRIGQRKRAGKLRNDNVGAESIKIGQVFDAAEFPDHVAAITKTDSRGIAVGGGLRDDIDAYLQDGVVQIPVIGGGGRFPRRDGMIVVFV